MPRPFKRDEALLLDLASLYSQTRLLFTPSLLTCPETPHELLVLVVFQDM
jgi:hypothetical protein